MRLRLLVLLLICAALAVPPAGDAPVLAQEGDPPAAEAPPTPPDNITLDEESQKDSAVRLYKEGVALLNQVKQGKAEDPDALQDCIMTLRQAAARGRKFHQAYYQLGIAYQMEGDWDTAIKQLEKALRAKDDFHEAWVEMGDAHMWAEDWDDADEAYAKALEIAPGYAHAHVMWAYSLTRRRAYQAAVEHLETAMELAPNNGMAKQLHKIAKNEADGPGWETTYVCETDHYVIRTNVSQEFADKVGEHAELIHEAYSQVFKGQDVSDDKFPIILYANQKEYVEAGSPQGSGGYYSPFIKKLVLFRYPNWVDTRMVLFHEGFHQYLDQFLTQAPQWFNEGHGDFFGAAIPNEDMDYLDIIGNWWRVNTVKQIVRGNNYTPIPKLMQMSQAQMYDRRRVGQHYAQAWSLVYFCWNYQGGKYAEPMRAYFEACMDGHGLKEAYERSFGRIDMDVFEQEWKAWVPTLKGKKPDK